VSWLFWRREEVVDDEQIETSEPAPGAPPPEWGPASYGVNRKALGLVDDPDAYHGGGTPEPSPGLGAPGNY
jgi:hypothetical protein